MLFFDLECAYCYKHGGGVICEFGYVLTDENFEVLQKEVLPIAPERNFEPYVVQNMLAFSEEEYNNSPNFASRYDFIKTLLQARDTAVIGHTIDQDACYLNFSAKRYDLPPIDFTFYDLKYMHMHRRKTKKPASVANILTDLQLEFQGHMHRSDDDAYCTMLALKELCRLSQKTAVAFLAEYKPYCGTNAEGKVQKAKLPPRDDVRK